MLIKNKFVQAIIWLSLTGSAGAITILVGAHLYLSPTLPSVDSLRDVRLQTPLRIYSNDGKLIEEIGEKRRTPIKFTNIPKSYIDALLSAEDAQFYSHNGVSIKGLMRAFSQLLISGDIQGGGSTITMQVARNFFLSKRQEFKRKFNEILLALRIERELTKEDILELYVNVIFLGNRAYGIEAAANVYYGKPLSQLNLPQLAMIAGLPKAPSSMNPLSNPKRAIQRRNWILKRMFELGKIDEPTYQKATAQALSANYHGNSLDLDASYVAEMARREAVRLYGQNAYSDGYRIYTTLDSKLQSTASKAVISGLLEYDRRHGFRGPEQKLPVPDEVLALNVSTSKVQPLESNADSEDKQTSTENGLSSESKQNESTLEEWYKSLQKSIKDIPRYADLHPAAVIKILDQSITCLLSSGEQVEILWDRGLKSARPFININARGPKPKSAHDVLALGDVVRIGRNPDDQWRLHQIPDAQAALVSLNPKNGAILALVGGFDFRQSNFNRVTQAKRQPGSNFKPFLYTIALENGYTAASIINDTPLIFKDRQLESFWRPENSDKNFLGPTRLRRALYRSRNLVSIKLLKEMGINKALENIGRFGFDKSVMSRDLSLALGSHDMTPLEIVTGYAVFANGGYKIEPYYIERILNFDGDTVHEALPPTVCHKCDDDSEDLEQLLESSESEIAQLSDQEPDNEPFNFTEDPFEVSRELKSQLGILEPQDYPRAPRVLDERVTYIMDSILKDVVKKGTATKAKVIKRSDLAGKTGTSNKSIDAWFSGYGGDIVTTTWMGFDQNTTLGVREFGGSAALPIWIKYMQVAIKDRPISPNPQPEGLVTVRIDPESGKKTTAGNSKAMYEVFREEYVPDFENPNEPTGPTIWPPQDLSKDELF